MRNSNDTLDLRKCEGRAVVAFNKGDGVDVVRLGHKTQLSLSLGGGISYTDLSYSRHGADLLLSTGGGDGITLAGWFSGPANRRVAMVQVIDGAGGGHETGAPFCHEVETFDFSAAVAVAEKARHATHPQESPWSLTDALLTQHLASSDSAALGGDLSYQFGKNGSFSAIGSAAEQEIVGSIHFGTLAQSFKPSADIQAGTAKLL